MRTDSILKKEGIIPVNKLNILDINKIARNIASRLVLAFPDFGLNINTLFAGFSRLNMIISKMPDNFYRSKVFL